MPANDLTDVVVVLDVAPRVLGEQEWRPGQISCSLRDNNTSRAGRVSIRRRLLFQSIPRFHREGGRTGRIAKSDHRALSDRIAAEQRLCCNDKTTAYHQRSSHQNAKGSGRQVGHKIQLIVSVADSPAPYFYS